MKFFRFLPIVAGVSLLGACQSHHSVFNPHYTQFRVTNTRGELIADWVAEGSFKKNADGAYDIKAVERTSGHPYSLTTQYPNGRRSLVGGPNIIYWRTGKPYWLYQIDGF